MKIFLHPLSHQIVRQQSGYTLIELLLYVAMLGALLTVVTFFFATATSARVKNQSIQEVNDQGTFVLEQLTQTIHNASAVTAPAIGASGTSLTLTVPTAASSPTVFSANGATSANLGYSSDGGATDSDNRNVINGTKFVASASGTISTLYALVGSTVSASPNNQAQMALYSGATTPTALLASSASATIVPNSWSSFSISPVNVTSGQTYWLTYNTNGLTAADNNLRYRIGAAGQGLYTGRTFGTWPASWTGTATNQEFSMYAPISSGSGPATLQIKEGAGALTSLTDSKVQVSGLVFKNLSRPSTPGVVQVSFVLSRVNPTNATEFEYQKTFTATAEVAW